MPGVDVYAAIARFARQDRIGYVHFRNVVGRVPSYREAFIDDGDVDMPRALADLRRERLRRRLHPGSHSADDVRGALARWNGVRARLHERMHPRTRRHVEDTAHGERRSLPAARRPDRRRGRRRRGPGDRSPHRTALLGRHPRRPALRERPRCRHANTSRRWGRSWARRRRASDEDGFAVAVADGFALLERRAADARRPRPPRTAPPHERRQVRLARTPVGRQHAHGVRARRRRPAPLGRPLTQRHRGHRLHPPERAGMERGRTRPCT